MRISYRLTLDDDYDASRARSRKSMLLRRGVKRGRWAVSIAFRDQGHGETLLMDALFRTVHHSKEVASAGAVVDAIDDAATAFYKKYGFLELPNVPARLLLPMGTIAALFK